MKGVIKVSKVLGSIKIMVDASVNHESWMIPYEVGSDSLLSLRKGVYYSVK